MVMRLLLYLQPWPVLLRAFGRKWAVLIIERRLRTLYVAPSILLNDFHPKAGGPGLELCSGDMLLQALVACAGVSLKAAATMLSISLKSANVIAEGDVDLRGTLGVSDDVPVGFKEIRLRFDIDTDASSEMRAQWLQLAERYCVVFQTIQNSPKTDMQLNLIRR